MRSAGRHSAAKRILARRSEAARAKLVMRGKQMGTEEEDGGVRLILKTQAKIKKEIPHIFTVARR